MKQTEGSNKGTDALQQQDDQQLTHKRPPRNWIIRNWKTVASVGGLFTAAGVGVALLDWASRAIDDVAVALNFFAQNTFSLLIFLAVIVQAVISNKQWRAMHDGLVRTDRVIQKMEEQSKSMSDEATATKTAADAAVKQVELMEKSLVLTMRPYLVVGAALRVFEADRQMLVEIVFMNEGNSIAEDVSVRYKLGISRTSTLPEAEMAFRTAPIRVGPHKNMSAYLYSKIITERAVRDIKNGTAWFFCWGTGTYSGIGGPYPPFDFCFVYRRETNDLSHCGDLAVQNKPADAEPSPDDAGKDGKNGEDNGENPN